MTFIRTCHRCPHFVAAAHAQCVANPAEPVLVKLRIREQYCPTGRYRLGWGDRLARALDRMGVRGFFRDFMAYRESVDAKIEGRPARGCGCQARQAAMNAIGP